MGTDYFTRLNTETPTRAWVNNPTIDEIDLAIAQGAVGSTTNPAYGGGLLKRAPELVRPVIAEAVAETTDNERAEALVQLKLVARVVEGFGPMFEKSEGTVGFVSIQGAPEADTDAAHIVAEGREGHALGPNATPKIPATGPGLEALEVLVAEGFPTIVTEVFSVSQLIEACERYVSVTKRTGLRPPFFLSPITGIFGDHLKARAARDGLDVPNAEMELVGVALSRECYRIVVAREYPVTLLCGGARIGFDLTGLVGAALHATINWSTFAEVLGPDVAFSRGIDDPIDPAVVARLERTFPEVRRALALDGLTVDEFESFGPVQHFRNNFIAGWTAVRAAIAEERTALALT